VKILPGLKHHFPKEAQWMESEQKRRLKMRQ
jgi:hypothetical protein